MAKTLILGIGNILLGDEGFGVRAVEYLDAHYSLPDDVELMDGGTRGLLLLGEIMECDFLVVFDIVLGGDKPGTIYLIEDWEIPQRAGFCHSMHQSSLADVLASCELAGRRPRALVFGLEPFEYQTLNPVLTPGAQKILPQFCARAVGELQKRGLNIRPRKSIA